MSRTNKEEIDKFIEGARLTGFTPLLTGPDYVSELADQFGLDRWNYYATIASLGSVLIKIIIELEEEEKFNLINSYKEGIKKWDYDALRKIDELMRYVTEKNTTTEREYHTCIGVWLIEQVKGSKIDNDKIDIATDLGRMIRSQMESYLRH